MYLPEREDRPSNEELLRLEKELGSKKQVARKLEIPYGTVYSWFYRIEKHEKIKSMPNNVLIIGDTHEPFTHPQYMEFCTRIRDKYKCKTIIHIGDEVDNHATSFHDHDPDGLSAGDEFQRAKEKLVEWYKVFPEMTICVGNHTLLPARKLMVHGISSNILKDHNQLWGIPDTWKWVESIVIDNVLYKHAPSKGGDFGFYNGMINDMISTVTGHQHSTAGVMYKTTEYNRTFALSVGCGVNIKEYAMLYAKSYAKRPILGCGVVLEGVTAIFEPMVL